MALRDCFDKALRAGYITQGQIERIAKRFETQQHELGVDERTFLESFIQEASESRRRASLQALCSHRPDAASTRAVPTL